MDRIFFIVKLIIIGLLSGFIGIAVFAVLVPPTDLYVNTRNILLAGFFTMMAGVIIVIYLRLMFMWGFSVIALKTST